jgi:teichuronic acid biosynthesis protein TuaE
VALLGGGVVLTAGLVAYAVRGHGSRGHLSIAVGLPLFVGVLLALALAWPKLARLPMRPVLAACVLALPALAVLGPALALPQLRALFAFRVVLAAVGLFGLAWLIITRPRWHLEATTFLGLFAAWFCWLVITLAWAPDPTAGLHYLVLFAELGVVAVATASAGTSRRRLRYMLLGLAAVYGLSLLVAMVEWRLGIHLPTASTAHGNHRRPATFFFNPNDYATFLALCWPFVLLLPTFRRTGGTIALTAAVLLVSAAALVFTESRSSLLALGLETVIVAAWALARGSRRRRLVLVALAAVVVLGAGVLLSGHGGASFQKFDIGKLISQERSGQGSGSVRLQLQFAGLRAAETRWFWGVGPGNAETIVAQQNPDFTVINLHDWWLEVFVDGGLPGLLIFLAMYAAALASMVRVVRRSRDPLLRYLGTATAVSLAGLTIALFGPSTAIKFPPIAILFGLAVAILIRARREDCESGEPQAVGRSAASSA